jgi:hypothetical protein
MDSHTLTLLAFGSLIAFAVTFLALGSLIVFVFWSQNKIWHERCALARDLGLAQGELRALKNQEIRYLTGKKRRFLRSIDVNLYLESHEGKLTRVIGATNEFLPGADGRGHRRHSAVSQDGHDRRKRSRLRCPRNASHAVGEARTAAPTFVRRGPWVSSPPNLRHISSETPPHISLITQPHPPKKGQICRSSVRSSPSLFSPRFVAEFVA